MSSTREDFSGKGLPQKAESKIIDSVIFPLFFFLDKNVLGKLYPVPVHRAVSTWLLSPLDM